MRWFLSLLLLAPLSGCSVLGEDDGQLHVAAAFYPLAFVADRITGTSSDLLTTPGAEPHDFELTIRETAEVARADLVVYERGFQPAVDAAVDQVAEGSTLDAADVVQLHPGDEDGVDPHFWLDPLLMAQLGDAVAAELSDLDPASAETYSANAADLRRELERLDREYAAGLTGCARRTVVVSHDAFGYLERYGIELAPIAGLSPGAEPTPAHLAQLQELSRERGITTVFAETLGSSKMADSLATDLGLQTRTLDPIEGVAADSGDDYFTVMRRNLANLQEANGC